MTIKLLMGAGAGSRFQNEGYSTPKPFIDVCGEPMFMHVARNLGATDVGGITFVTQTKFSKHVERTLLGVLIDRVVYVPDLTAAGPAWSAVAATLDEDPDEDVFLMDSDCFVKPLPMNDTALSQILYEPVQRYTKCIVYGNTGNDDKGLARIVLDGQKVLIKEGGTLKKDIANIGIYWFKSVRLLRQLAATATAIKAGQRHVTEVKVSDMVNMLAETEVDIGMVQGSFINLGTPEGLNAYQKGKHGTAE
jgi:bifunctional N-acetylglucosamine-1-phosphate-uridyltransferase/glucosamine-1-phosphate-acetyltransferase GlmU-like protein